MSEFLSDLVKRGRYYNSIGGGGGARPRLPITAKYTQGDPITVNARGAALLLQP